jgi:hypothetical protein
MRHDEVRRESMNEQLLVAIIAVMVRQAGGSVELNASEIEQPGDLRLCFERPSIEVDGETRPGPKFRVFVMERPKEEAAG